MSVYDLNKAAKNYSNCEHELNKNYIETFMSETINIFVDQQYQIRESQIKIEKLEKTGQAKVSK